MSVIGLANQTLTTPALIDVVRHFPENIPQDVSRYITGIFERNLIRNGRLAEQLIAALAAINEIGITPLLLKGSAILATSHQPQMGRRLISDLDILVSPDEVERVLNCLFQLGYRLYFQTPGNAAKWYAELERPGDVGMIDLHTSPPGHRFFYRASGKAKDHCQLLSCEGGGKAYIPSATYHALMLIIHDEFQDADYWVGKIDLRHLLDLRDMANSPGGIDWELLASFSQGKLARNAIETQLVTLFFLLDVDVPAAMRSRLVPRLQNWRRMLQTRLPALSDLFLIMTLLDYWNYRGEVGLEERRARRLEPRTWVLPKRDTARFLHGLSREKRAGKV